MNSNRNVYFTRLRAAQLFFTCAFFILLASCSQSAKGDQPEVAATKSVAVNQTSKNINLKYSTEQLDNTKGLSNSSVNCIFQDSQNLIWIGTWDGLNRYDGTNFKIFRSESGKENSLSNQVILKVGEDSTGQIWVLTMHGINRYDKKTDTFQQFYFARKNKPPLTESEFNMALDESKNVFCAVKDWGIGYFEGNDFQQLDARQLSGKTVRKMSFAGRKLVLLLENGELYSLTISDESGVKRISELQ
ncbi:MAG: hybrid sensor histidine kinase/response regulator, partial [Proteobacteria bacterium]